jgi:glycosyltransferase involved in cell wall biosynthesis
VSLPEHIFYLGYPGYLGGANSEAWHLLKLLASMGIRITAIPTWRAEPAWEDRLARIGITTRRVGIRDFRHGLPSDLRGSVVLGMCNAQFIRLAPRLKAAGCRLVYLPCMCFVQHAELCFLCDGGRIDAWVFQSRFQHDRWISTLQQFDQSQQMRIIPGAFDIGEFPFRRPQTQTNGSPLVVGHLSRPDPAKFPRELWEIFGTLRRVGGVQGFRARVMAWSPVIERHCGPPPPWAEVLPRNAEPSRLFLESLDILVQLNGTAEENWPRVGLEAMAVGVPMIVDARGGWFEMVRGGVDAWLVYDSKEAGRALRSLAGRPQQRARMAIDARARVEEIAAPGPIAAAWYDLLEGLRE